METEVGRYRSFEEHLCLSIVGNSRKRVSCRDTDVTVSVLEQTDIKSKQLLFTMSTFLEYRQRTSLLPLHNVPVSVSASLSIRF